MLERQLAGIEKAKEEGRYKSRGPTHFSRVIFWNCYNRYFKASKEVPYKLKRFAEDLGISSSTLVRILREHAKTGTIDENRFFSKENDF